MEGCFLCLKNHKENVAYIQVNSTHWLEFNIHNIIEKHLWPIEPVDPSSFLCILCWKELYDFHKFFITIKAAQTKSYEIGMEPHCLQISKQSMVSFEEDQVKLERLTNKSPIIESRYDPQILMDQPLPTSTLRKCASTLIINENTILNVKLEEEGFPYNSSLCTNSFQEYSHRDLRSIESDETNSIVTEINESNFRFNPNGNSEVKAKDNRHEYQQNTTTSDEQTHTLFINCQSPKKEDDILEEMFVQHVTKNVHTVKLPAKRGRPRKNFGNTLLSTEILANRSETENHNSFISIQQEDEYDEDISLKKKKRGRPKNSQKNCLISQQKKKMRAISMISRPARKRILPRKYLTYEVESTNDGKIKTKIPKELYLYLKSGKRGRPRKILINSMNSSNMSFEQNSTTEFVDQQHKQLCADNMPKKTTGKRGRPRKYFTKDIVRPQEFCSEMPSTSTGKRGRPRKYFTNNDIISTEIPKEQTVKLENSIPVIVNQPRVKSKLKNRKRCRPYKDLMRNYIATSVRCMQLFKSKNGVRSESENSCMV